MRFAEIQSLVLAQSERHRLGLRLDLRPADQCGRAHFQLRGEGLHRCCDDDEAVLRRVARLGCDLAWRKYVAGVKAANTDVDVRHLRAGEKVGGVDLQVVGLHQLVQVRRIPALGVSGARITRQFAGVETPLALEHVQVSHRSPARGGGSTVQEKRHRRRRTPRHLPITIEVEP